MVRSALPWVGFLLGVLCTEAALGLFSGTLPPTVGDDARVFAIGAALRDGPYDVLFLGDSTAKGAAIPSVFDAIAGTRSVNLSVNRHVTSAADLHYLQEYLSRYPAPKAVFALRSIHMWSNPQNKDLIEEYFFTPSVVSRVFSSRPFPLEEYGRSVAGMILPSVRRAITFRRRLLPQKDASFEFVAQNFGDSGYMRDDAVSAFTGSLRADPPTAQSLAALRGLCDVAIGRRVPLFVSIGPNEYENADDVAETLSRALSSFGSAYCSYLPLPAVDQAYQSDPIHVNHSGALIVTEALARAFEKRARSYDHTTSR